MNNRLGFYPHATYENRPRIHLRHIFFANGITFSKTIIFSIGILQPPLLVFHHFYSNTQEYFRGDSSTNTLTEAVAV